MEDKTTDVKEEDKSDTALTNVQVMEKAVIADVKAEDFRNMSGKDFSKKYPDVRVEDAYGNLFMENGHNRQFIAPDMEFPGGSEEVYMKWAEEELRKVIPSEEELQKGFSDLLISGTEMWRCRGGQMPPERIVPGSAEWWDIKEKIAKHRKGEIEKEIKRLKEQGINADQEDKSPAEEYADSIAEHWMIEELESELLELTTPEEAIKAEMEPRTVTDIYETLEPILDDIIDAGMNTWDIRHRLQTIITKLEKTIQSGRYIQKGEI